MAIKINKINNPEDLVNSSFVGSNKMKYEVISLVDQDTLLVAITDPKEAITGNPSPSKMNFQFKALLKLMEKSTITKLAGKETPSTTVVSEENLSSGSPEAEIVNPPIVNPETDNDEIDNPAIVNSSIVNSSIVNPQSSIPTPTMQELSPEAEEEIKETAQKSYFDEGTMFKLGNDQVITLVRVDHISSEITWQEKGTGDEKTISINEFNDLLKGQLIRQINS